MRTAQTPFEKSNKRVKNAAILFPVRKTLVAPMFPDPTFLKSPSPKISEIRIPKGIEPARYPKANNASKTSNLLVNSGSTANIQK